jgi:hypothetical protein
LAFFQQKSVSFFAKFGSLFFKKRQIFRRKLAKLAEICDHNIDPSIAGRGFEPTISSEGKRDDHLNAFVGGIFPAHNSSGHSCST